MKFTIFVKSVRDKSRVRKERKQAITVDDNLSSSHSLLNFWNTRYNQLPITKSKAYV